MNRDIPIQFTPEYEVMLKRAEDKLRGNISSEKMTEEQTQAEIARVTEGVFAPGCTIHGTHTMPSGEVIEVGPQIIVPAEGYRTKSGRLYRSKPGRKPKVK